jgi:hypothetical protein
MEAIIYSLISISRDANYKLAISDNFYTACIEVVLKILFKLKKLLQEKSPQVVGHSLSLMPKHHSASLSTDT